MAKPRSRPAPGEVIDLRSADPVLFYAGGPLPPGVPARDLSGNDLGRIAYVRAQQVAIESESYQQPGQASQGALTAIADELVALGTFTRAPAPPAEPED